MEWDRLHEDLERVLEDLHERNRQAPIIVEGEYARRAYSPSTMIGARRFRSWRSSSTRSRSSCNRSHSIQRPPVIRRSTSARSMPESAMVLCRAVWLETIRTD